MNEPRLLSHLLDWAAIPSHRAEAEALTDGKGRLTWVEYADRVARMAGALASLGARPGDRIGVHLPKSVDSFVAVHAALRVGGVMVPLDSFAPIEHTHGVMADAGVEVVVTSAKGRGLTDLAAGGTLRAAIDLAGSEEPAPVDVRTRDDVASMAPASLVEVDPSAPAYIIYTSGSTGRPKGIVHTHHSALAYAGLAVDTYGVTGSDRMANIAPLHFDQSTFELYAAPLAGAAVVVVPDGVLRFPASLSTLLADERVSVWYSVPYLIDQLASRGALEDRDLGPLRWVLFGGESFPPGALTRAMERLPTARFSNVYGPAEVNQCTFFHLDNPPDGEDAIPIGRAWLGADLMVVGDDDELVEAGAVGELLVRTETMMDRYWNRPDLTEAATTIRAGERWYRTGDLVQERNDGNLVFLGRRDNQVKVRGHRIELEAVEAVVAEFSGVEASVVVVDRPGDGDDRLVAIVMPASIVSDEFRRALRAELNRRLPRYAVPAEIVGVDRLPRTGTDKVDRPAAARQLRAGR